MNAITTTLPRLARVLGLLGSDHDGEVLAAAKAAEMIRRQMGLQWDALLGAHPASAEAGRGGHQPPPRPADHWREMVRDCRRCPARLTEWESQFVESVARRDHVSPKQYTILSQIAAKVRA